MKTLQQLGISPAPAGFVGKKIEMEDVFDRDIVIHAFRITDSKYPKKNNDKRMDLQIEIDGAKRLVFTTSINLMNVMKQVGDENLPILTKIIKKKDTRAFEFADPSAQLQ